MPKSEWGKCNLVSSSLGFLLEHGQQVSFKLAFFAIMCFRTHSNIHLACVRLLQPSVTTGGIYDIRLCVDCQKMICLLHYWDAIQYMKRIKKAFRLLIISVALQPNITEPSIHCNEQCSPSVHILISRFSAFVCIYTFSLSLSLTYELFDVNICKLMFIIISTWRI